MKFVKVKQRARDKRLRLVMLFVRFVLLIGVIVSCMQQCWKQVGEDLVHQIENKYIQDCPASYELYQNI